MKKTLIHSFTVNRQGEKIQLQIRLPRNTKSVEQILVTSTGSPRRSSPKQEVGWLWLRIPEQRDVFFAHILKAPLQLYDKATLAAIPSLSFGSGVAWVDGGKESSFSITVPGNTTLIEGYYTDELKGTFIRAYSVKIYLTLEV